MTNSQSALSKKALQAVNDQAKLADKEKAQKALEKRVSEHPIYLLLDRAAASGELPHKDELQALKVSKKYRDEIDMAARRIAREAKSLPDADEVRREGMPTKVKGYTSARFAARSMAFDKATAFVKGLPSNHETQSETEARQADMDPEAVADKVMRNIGRMA